MGKIPKTALLLLAFGLTPPPPARAEKSCLSDPSFTPPPIRLVGEDHYDDDCIELKATLPPFAGAGKLLFATEVRPDGPRPMFAGRVQPDGSPSGEGLFGLDTSLIALTNSYVIPYGKPFRKPSKERTEDLAAMIYEQILNTQYTPLGPAFSLKAPEPGRIQTDMAREYFFLLEKFGKEQCAEDPASCAKAILRKLLGDKKYASLPETEKEKQLEEIYLIHHGALVSHANETYPDLGWKLEPLPAINDLEVLKSKGRFRYPPTGSFSSDISSQEGFLRVGALRSLKMAENLQPALCEAAKRKLPLVVVVGARHAQHFREIFPKMRENFPAPEVLSCKAARELFTPQALLSSEPLSPAPDACAKGQLCQRDWSPKKSPSAAEAENGNSARHEESAE